MSSKFFAWMDGKAYDRCIKPYNPAGFEKGFCYIFSLNGVKIAQLFKMSRNDWTVVVLGDLNPLVPRSVGGFRTRTDAIEYALMVHERTRSTYNRDNH